MKTLLKSFFLFLILPIFSFLSADTNIAIGATASQSSQYKGFSADLAIDDDLSNFQHTKNSTNYEWFMVDLGSIQRISSLKFYKKAGQEVRSKNIYFLISDTNFNPSTDSSSLAASRNLAKWEYKVDNISGSSFVLDTGNITGRYILLQKDNEKKNNEKFLNFSELQVYSPSILPAVSSYRFDECSYNNLTGEVKDSIGAVNGKATNGTDTNASDSILCSSAHFNGASGIEIPDNTLHKSNQITISTWIKPTSWQTWSSIVMKTSSGWEDGYGLYRHTDNNVSFFINHYNNTKVTVSADLNVWTHIVAVYDGTQLRIYKNGVLKEALDYTMPINHSNTSLYIGKSSYGADDMFEGFIDEVKIFNQALLPNEIATIYNNELSGGTYDGSARACSTCITSYCANQGLSEGFHIIDPDNGDDENSYEIYCDTESALAPRDLIALPLKNTYNNFSFKDDSPSVLYYDEVDDAIATDPKNSFAFLEINIDGSDIYINPRSLAAGSINEGYFSNINLIGTPFAIDWDSPDTIISHCDTDKLRIGAWDQAVKINTIDYTNGRCKAEKIKLKILPNYKYLTYPDIRGTTDNDYGGEVIEETCRQIFERIPNDADHLLTSNSDGYYWIDPDKAGRGAQTGLTDKFRPFVAYCKYQADIDQAWTFVMALDAKVTNSKDDIKSITEVRANPNDYYDTCSQLGLLFFVPNTKDTFTRTQAYLYDNKEEWVHYTGTIREKYKMFSDKDNYYIAGEGYNEIWPYGPFGLYHPYGGNKDANGDYQGWRGTDDTVPGWMSGRCMNSGLGSGAPVDGNGVATCVDNPTYGDMGSGGFRTTLKDMVERSIAANNGDMGITNYEHFWIADVGAGNYLTKSTTKEYSVTGPGEGGDPTVHRTAYYEPNGNYTANAWLNYVADSNGNVYHNDDNGAYYSYYDYMCMAWDNYHTTTRLGLTDGPFTVIEHTTIDTSAGYPVTAPSDFNITTKIVNDTVDFDALLLNSTRDEIVDDQNISAGLFLVKYTMDANDQETTSDIHYYGQIGSNDSFNLSSNPRGIINLNTESPYPLTKIDKSYRRLSFEYKYCGLGDVSWTDCWNTTGTAGSLVATCATGYDSLGKPRSPCKVADSNDFAVRPDKFSITSLAGVHSGSTLLVKAEDVNISYVAYDKSATPLPSNDYNVSFSNLDTGVNLITSGKTCATSYLNDTNQSNYAFANGEDAHVYTLTDVGVYNFLLQEIEGQEFAKIDAADTPWADRQITPNSTTLTILPHHFTISTPPTNLDFNHAAGGNPFTYLSNDLTNMAATMTFKATAQNHTGGATLNYSNTCYANDVNLTAKFIVSVGDLTTPSALTNLQFKDQLTTGASETNTSATALQYSLIVPKTNSFTSDQNGTGSFSIKFNFTRETNATKDPFQITFNDLNVSDQTYSALQVGIDTTGIISANATFYYGRAQGPKRAVTKICHTTPCVTSDNPDANSPRLIYQIFSTNAASPLLYGATNSGTGDLRWFENLAHSEANNDGIIGPVIAKDGSGDPSYVNRTVETNYRFAYHLRYNGTIYPYTADMKNTPSSWLIYDENNASATYNTFQVEFRKDGAWSGKHETTTTTTSKAKGVSNRRVMW
jgi:hypothetical protein